MIRYTSKEYKEGFDIKMSEYLLAFEDNTHLSFLDLQKERFTTYNNALLSIANELKEYGELEANKIFLPNTVFDGLKKINSQTYDDIRIEEKFQPVIKGFQTYGEYRENKKTSSENFCTRIDYNKLKNHLTSAKKILNFIEGKYQIIEQEEQPIKTLTLDNLDDPSLIVTSILEEVVPTELKSEDFIDPHKREKDTIDEKLKVLKVYLSVDDYNLLASSLLWFFTTNDFPKLDSKIMFKKLDRKYVGWVLKEIWQCFKTDKFDKRIIEFAVHNINKFEGCEIPEGKLFGTNIYKAFTTKPKSYKYR